MKIDIDPQLQKVIDLSSFTIDEGVYVYTRVKDVINPENHLIVTRDSDEITVVTDVNNLKDLGEFERNEENWKLINIRCGNPFYCVGFLAAISSQTAMNGIDITMTSTFTNDYIMVKEDELDKCTKLLIELGFQKRESRK